MDRQPIGVVAASLIAATVLTLAAIPQKERILISAVICPEQMTYSKDEYVFGISFVAARDLRDVEARVRTLPGFTPQSFGLESAGQQDLEMQPPLDVLRQASSRLGIEVEAERFDLKLDAWAQLVYYDFLPVLERLSPNLSDSHLRQVTASYGFLWNRSGLEACFMGGGEIFPTETVSLSKILVEVDGASAYIWEGGTNLERQMGRIGIGTVARGSRVDLMYYVDGRWAGGGLLLWKVDLVAEGQILHSTMRLINAGASS